MKIETYIDSLVSYAMNTGLADPLDHQVLTNRLLDILRKDDYEPSNETQTEDLEEILAGLLDYAVKTGMDAVLGEGACHILSIRPQGGVEMEVEA